VNRESSPSRRWLVLVGKLLYAASACAAFAVLRLTGDALEAGALTVALPSPLPWLARELPRMLPAVATLWLVIGGAMILLGGIVLRPTSR
jgi:hypothetical protein